jgi:hypothetical protein
LYLEKLKMINKIINVMEWQEICCTNFWISKKVTMFKVLFHLTEFVCFQIPKKYNRNGWQWKSSIMHCGIFPLRWGLLVGNMWSYSEQEIVSVNTLTTKMPSVLYSSFL